MLSHQSACIVVIARSPNNSSLMKKFQFQDKSENKTPHSAERSLFCVQKLDARDKRCTPSSHQINICARCTATSNAPRFV